MELLYKLIPLYIPGLIITLVLYLLNKITKYKNKLVKAFGNPFKYKIIMIITYILTFIVFAYLSSSPIDTRYMGIGMLIVYIYLLYIPKELR